MVSITCLWEFFTHTNTAISLSPLSTMAAPKSILGRISNPRRAYLPCLPQALSRSPPTPGFQSPPASESQRPAPRPTPD